MIPNNLYGFTFSFIHIFFSSLNSISCLKQFFLCLDFGKQQGKKEITLWISIFLCNMPKNVWKWIALYFFFFFWIKLQMFGISFEKNKIVVFPHLNWTTTKNPAAMEPQNDKRHIKTSANNKKKETKTKTNRTKTIYKRLFLLKHKKLHKNIPDCR